MTTTDTWAIRHGPLSPTNERMLAAALAYFRDGGTLDEGVQASLMHSREADATDVELAENLMLMLAAWGMTR